MFYLKKKIFLLCATRNDKMRKEMYFLHIYISSNSKIVIDLVYPVWIEERLKEVFFLNRNRTCLNIHNVNVRWHNR